MSKIYDCFVFNDELDLLDIRLNILNNVVDYFILIEGERTWQNNKKIPFFENNKHRFAKFIDKIYYVVIPEAEFVPHTWTNERMSFDKILDVLKTTSIKNNDIVLVSSCDEIPNPNQFNILKDTTLFPTHFQQKLYYYYINTIFNHWGTIYCGGTSAITFEQLLQKGSVYDTITERSTNNSFIKNGGWHFSYLGGADQIYTKVRSFSHEEYKNMTKEEITQQVALLKDLYNRHDVYLDSLDPEENWPMYIQQNKENFSKFIYKQ